MTHGDAFSDKPAWNERSRHASVVILTCQQRQTTGCYCQWCRSTDSRWSSTIPEILVSKHIQTIDGSRLKRHELTSHTIDRKLHDHMSDLFDQREFSSLEPRYEIHLNSANQNQTRTNGCKDNLTHSTKSFVCFGYAS